MTPTRVPAPAGSLLGAGLDDVVYALRHAKRSVSIATPFLSHRIATLLVRESIAASRRRLLVALNDAAVEGGYLDPRGVETFVAAGYEVRSLLNLHAKVVISDSRWALIGSGNLTVAGFDGGNAELGIVLGATQAASAERDYFEPWWQAAEALDLSHLRRLSRRRPTSPQRRRRAGQGGIYRTDAGEELAALVHDPSRTGYWLKIMHYRPERAPASRWKGNFWISDVHRLRPSDSAPLMRPTYAIGDRLVIYLSREGRKACPAIVRVTAKPEYDPELVAREARPGDEEHWAWVTEVVGERAIDLEFGPTLSDIGVASSSVRQHSHIVLTYEQFQSALRAIPAAA